MRKKGANGQESRARLLTVAASEFARSGYHKTKISTIVSRAGLTQPSFYLYFESKEAVFNELMDKFRSQLKELVIDSRLEAGISREDIPSRIRAILSNLFGFLEQDPDLTQIGFFIGEDAEEIKEELTSILAHNLRAEQAEGYFQQDLDMTIVAECLVGAIERLTLQELLSGKRTADELAHQVVNLYLFGIRAHRES
ncbi:TetR/AcrR family transcriptional regulator [Paenibacillus sp. EC2-1]|uniref:TetR/AcrR family transcriptional regulator n=1 Tax=Paenibacillus sp. EC2-1 TaxID=3388665 RepID=UPI003BEEDFE7